MRSIFIRLLLLVLMISGLDGSAQTPLQVFPPIPGVNNSLIRFHDTGSDSGNRLWLGSGNYGAMVYDSISDSWSVLNTTSGLPSDSVTCLGFLPGETWLGTKMGLVKYTGVPGSGGAVDAIYTMPQLPADLVTAVLAETGMIWTGTQSGLARLNTVAGTWDYFSTGNDSITKIHRDDTGKLWVGTRNGLFVTNNNGITWTNYNASNTGNVLSNYIFDIEDDVHGRIWISSGTSTTFNIICNVSYFSNNLWTRFDINQFEYGYYSNSPVLPNLNFTKSLNGEVVFANTVITGNQGSVIKPSSCDLQIFDLKSAGSFVCNPPMQFGFIFDVMPNGRIFRITGRTFCAIAINPDSLWYPVTDLAVIPPPLSNTCDGCGAPVTKGAAYIDINLVNAMVISGGNMHWDQSAHQYEVPKGSGLHTIYNSSHWIGGIDAGGQIRVAAQTYRQSGLDYWAGPIDGLNIPAGDSTAKYFDRVYKVSRWEIESFKNHFQNGTLSYQPCNNNVPLSIMTWPAKGNGPIIEELAPFVDVDGNGWYNPLTGGDYPLIQGDQMLFKVYNDSLNIHTETDSAALGFEFRTSVYAFLCDNIQPTDKVINYTTFYKTQIINKSNRNYTQVRFGLWSDGDIGNYIDDFIGCDISRNTGYFYNGDNNDEGLFGYGLNPPIMNVKILKGPLAPLNDGKDNNNNGITDEPGETLGMNNFIYNHGGGGPVGNPAVEFQFYNSLRGFWLDGNPITYGNYGYNSSSTDTCGFLYPGITDPHYYPLLGDWTEFTAGNSPSDRRFMLSSGPFDMNIGDAVEFDYAYIFTRDSLSGGNLNFALNNANLDLVQSWFDNNSFPGCVVYTTGVSDPQQNLFHVYPNPATEFIHISNAGFDVTGMKYEIYNLLGEKIREGFISQNQINVSSLTAQVYILKIKTPDYTYTTRIVKM